MNPLFLLKRNMLTAMFNGLTCADDDMSAMLLEVAVSPDAENWRRRACTIQWYYHFAQGKTVAELANMEALRAQWQNPDIYILKHTTGVHSMYLHVEGNIFLLNVRIPKENLSRIYLRINSTSVEESSEILENKHILKITEVAAIELIDESELEADQVSITNGSRMWVCIENLPAWLQNENWHAHSRVREWEIKNKKKIPLIKLAERGRQATFTDIS